MSTLKKVIVFGLIAIAVLYPFIVYLGIQRFEPKFIGLFIAAIYLGRAMILAKSPAAKMTSATGLGLFATGIWLSNNEYFLTLIPVFINLIALSIFVYSFFQRPTIPAQFAVKVEGKPLNEAQMKYTDKLTAIWILFFILNGSIALYSALLENKDFWLLYNGFISYVLIGALFVSEYLYRTLIFNKQFEK